MPTKPLSPSEVDGINHLVRVTLEFLEHPDVVEIDDGAPVTRRKLETVWGLVRVNLQQHPARLAPSATLAGKLSYAAQEAADVLSRPEVTRIPFAVRTTNVASALREVVRRMKAFRR
jgi:hypothetical protein